MNPEESPFRGAARIDIRGESLVLLPDKALWWPDGDTLFVADTHFGKSATFRSYGIPAPDDTRHELARLENLLSQTNARRLMVLGDFWHSVRGRSAEVLRVWQSWRDRHSDLSIVVIRGNHDRGANLFPASWRIVVVETWEEDELFRGSHIPEVHPARYVLSGHVHPSLTLRDRHGGSLRAPCFVVGKHRAILPAFGSFTGMETWNPLSDDRLFAVGPTEVIEIPRRRNP